MQAKHSGRLTECILVGETEIKSYFQSPIRIRTADLLARFRLARYVSNEGRRCIERKVTSPYWRQHRFVCVCVCVCVCVWGGGIISSFVYQQYRSSMSESQWNTKVNSTDFLSHNSILTIRLNYFIIIIMLHVLQIVDN